MPENDRMIAVSLRDATVADSDFCYRTKKAAHRVNIEATYGPWDENFQRQFHDDQWQPTGVEIVCVDAAPVGWLCWAEHADRVEVDGIYIGPEHQRRGIGSRVMDHMKSMATASAKPIRLWVMKKNSAVRFYTKQGFVRIGEKPTHWHMEWNA